MSRLARYIELLAHEGYSPAQTSDDELRFESEGETFWLKISAGPDSTFIMLHRVFKLSGDYRDDVLIRLANSANRYECAIKLWINVDDRTLWVAFEAFYDNDIQLLAHLENVLPDMRCAIAKYFDELEKVDTSVTETEAANVFGADRQDAANDWLGSSEVEAGNGFRIIKEVSVMEPSSETDNKLRCRADVGDATFNLYIPKWRVPKPWPRRIIVAIGRPINQELPSTRLGLSSRRTLERELPIVAVVDRFRDHTKTVRFRPRGDQEKWEVGEPYIPYALLPDKRAQTVELEVRWDLTGGTWSD